MSYLIVIIDVNCQVQQDPDHHAPVEVMVPHLCPSKNNKLLTPPLYLHKDVY